MNKLICGGQDIKVVYELIVAVLLRRGVMVVVGGYYVPIPIDLNSMSMELTRMLNE